MGGGLVGSGVWGFLAGSLAGPLPSCNSEAAPMLEATELREKGNKTTIEKTVSWLSPHSPHTCEGRS